MLSEAAGDERRSLVLLLVTLMEFDKRRLAEGTSHGSLFRYCTRVLKYSEDAAYKRIQAARKAKAFPSIIRRLALGELSLSSLNVLAPHLTSENHRRLLDQTRGKPIREIEKFVACLSPRPAPCEVVRHRPSPPAPFEPPESRHDTSDQAAPSAPSVLLPSCPLPPPRAKIQHLAPDCIRFAFNGSDGFLGKVDRCRDLLRHKYPQGKLEDIFDEAVEALLDARDPDRRKQPRRREADPKARRIPAWVRDAVWKRDGGCCSFVDDQGLRCGGRDFLEYDHVVPWARGGPSDDPGNIRVLCRSHNQHEARRIFGPAG